MERRWQDILRVAERRPYIQLQSVGDARDHPECTKLDGIIVKYDSAWLQKHLPPHRHKCRCTLRSLSNRQMEREGLMPTNLGELP